MINKRWFQTALVCILIFSTKSAFAAFQYDTNVLERLANLLFKYESDEVARIIVEKGNDGVTINLNGTLRKSAYGLFATDKNLIDKYSLAYDMHRFGVAIDTVEREIVGRPTIRDGELALQRKVEEQEKYKREFAKDAAAREAAQKARAEEAVRHLKQNGARESAASANSFNEEVLRQELSRTASGYTRNLFTIMGISEERCPEAYKKISADFILCGNTGPALQLIAKIDKHLLEDGAIKFKADKPWMKSSMTSNENKVYGVYDRSYYHALKTSAMFMLKFHIVDIDDIGTSIVSAFIYSTVALQ